MWVICWENISLYFEKYIRCTYINLGDGAASNVVMHKKTTPTISAVVRTKTAPLFNFCIFLLEVQIAMMGIWIWGRVYYLVAFGISETKKNISITP